MQTERAEVDPRVRRTRQALHEALERLLERDDLEKISVGDIAEAANLNRATFYAHYADKYELLEALVDVQFSRLLSARGIVFGGCDSALEAMILGVCDYLAATPRLDCERQRRMEPHIESAVIAVVRGMMLRGLRRETTGTEPAISLEMIATTASWAIYGAAKEWVYTAKRCPSHHVVESVTALVKPILHQAHVAAATA